MIIDNAGELFAFAIEIPLLICDRVRTLKRVKAGECRDLMARALPDLTPLLNGKSAAAAIHEMSNEQCEHDVKFFFVSLMRFWKTVAEFVVF